MTTVSGSYHFAEVYGYMIALFPVITSTDYH